MSKDNDVMLKFMISKEGESFRPSLKIAAEFNDYLRLCGVQVLFSDMMKILMAKVDYYEEESVSVEPGGVDPGNTH